MKNIRQTWQSGRLAAVCCQNKHHQVFWSHLASANPQILLQSGARWHIMTDLRCRTILPASISALSRKDRIWRKFSCSQLAVDISRYRASCCAEQPPVSMERSIARCRAWKKLLCNVSCIGRKQDSIFKSGVWTYISCNLWTVWSTNFVFPQIIYWRVLRADTWPGASKVMYLFLVLQSQRQVAEPHSCSMDKTRLLKNTFCGWISISSCPVTVLQSDFKFKLQLHHHIIMQIASLLSLSFQVHCQVDPNWSNGWHRILDRSCHHGYFQVMCSQEKLDLNLKIQRQWANAAQSGWIYSFCRSFNVQAKTIEWLATSIDQKLKYNG